jgi:ABC-2 type transport system permease protein
MNWRVMAKKDFLDAYRKWSLATAAVGFVLFLAVPTYLGMSRARNPGAVDFFGYMQTALFFVPLAGLMMSYGAIAGERELGSLKLLLALPYTRRDVIAGKAVGRAAVVGAAAFIGVFAATLVFVAFGGSLSLAAFVAFLVLLFLLAAAYTGSAVCLSAASPTSNRAMATGVGFFLLSFIGWSAIPLVIRYVINGFSTPGGRPSGRSSSKTSVPSKPTRTGWTRWYAEAPRTCSTTPGGSPSSSSWRGPWFRWSSATDGFVRWTSE